MERGLRQGDLLSPFLFLFIGEALYQIIQISVNNGRWKGIQIASSGVHITHLQFADDLILFCSKDWETMQNIKAILMWFQGLLGLKVNLKKCCIYGIGVDYEELERIANYFGCSHGKLPFNYLGM